MADLQLRWLLLLLPPPQPADRKALKVAYEGLLTRVLRDIASEPTMPSATRILEITLPVESTRSNSQSHQTRSASYDQVQRLVAGVYRLICVIAAQENINIEDSGGVDVRVIMAAYSNALPSDHVLDFPAPLVTPVIDLQSLARSHRSWSRIEIDKSDLGAVMYRHFTRGVKPAHWTQISPSASQSTEELPGQVKQAGILDHKDHFSVAVGGTFDHLHVGHKLLLTMFAFILADEDKDGKSMRALTVGITGDELLKNKKYAEHLESWEERQSKTFDFLRAIMDFRPPSQARVKSATRSEPGPNGRGIDYWIGDKLEIKCVELSDPFGPTITDEDISALVVSAETRSGGKAVNDKRREKNWADLEVFEVDVLDTNEHNEEASIEGKLSSTTIRKNMQDRLERP